MDHGVLVYKIDNPIQSSLSSSLVLTLIQVSFSWLTLRSWVHNSNRVKEEIYTKEREGISVVKRRERGGTWVYIGITEERVY